MALSEKDFIEAAQELGAEVAAIKAVTKVESRGNGFSASGKVIILFEAHLFSRFTNHRFDNTHPDISSRKWNKALYKGGDAEWKRLLRAAELDKEPAYRSASYGLFQILGDNHRVCGFDNVMDFVAANQESEAKQLMCFINFVKGNKLDTALINKDWVKFARGYNGPQFAKNSYHLKLAREYEKAK